jgi:adenosylhomocysteine nucleosidase
VSILFVMPMQEELDFFIEGFSNRGYRTKNEQIGRLPVVKLPELGISLARGGTGKVQFGIQTQHLLDTYQDWDLIVCAGAAGALVDYLAIGDIVVATRTIEHDFNNRFSQRPLPSFPAAEKAIASLKELSIVRSDFSLYFGPVASGDEDIIDMERRAIVHQKTVALVAAWEGAGGARACKFSDFPFLEIRGVTDIADHNAPADFESNLSHAMENLASLVVSWLG